MTLFRTVDPAAEPVTLGSVKEHLRLSHAGEDALLEGLIRAARDEVERSTGVALIEQNWRLALDDWPAADTLALLRHPVREILSVTIYGADGEAALLPPDDYLLDGDSRPARLHFSAKPETHKVLNGIEIDFIAGFGEAGTDVPDLLRRAILVLVAHWYEFRGHAEPDQHPLSYPAGYERLLAGYKLRRL